MPQSHTYPLPVKTDTDHKKELYAVCAALSIVGIGFSTWASRVPDVRDAAVLTAATLGYALTARGMGTLGMMPIIATTIRHYGAKKSALVSGCIAAFSMLPIAFVDSWVTLGALLFVLGGSLSGFNISVNALASRIESETGRSHMSQIHSWFGIGNLFGAIAGTGATYFGLSVFEHFTLAVALILTILITGYRYLPEDTTHQEVEHPGFRWPHGGLIALGIIIFMAATIEQTINNWIGIFFTDYLKVEEGFGSVGYMVFAGSLLVMRLIGDRLKNRFGARNLLVTGCLVATGGLMLAIFSPNNAVATIGVFITGAGVAFNFPMVFSAAGREGAIALTSVATFGYVAGMVSQPAMGWMVEHFGLDGGFFFIALVTLSVSILAWRARMLKPVGIS